MIHPRMTHRAQLVVAMTVAAVAQGCSDDTAAADAGATDVPVAVDVGTDAGNAPDVFDAGLPDQPAVAPDTGAADAGVASNVLYVESNNPTTAQNAILAYARAADGSLTALPVSPFLTGGTGFSNPMQILGPADSDQEIVVTPDHRRLFAVNSGSNTVAVFDVRADGSLAAVAGSPFQSGGVNPVSLGLAGDRLYVVNKAQDPGQNTPSVVPNYTAFTVSAAGALTAIPDSTVLVTAGGSPSQALVSRDAHLVFGTDFLAPMAAMPMPPLRSFSINANGTLTAAPGTPMALPTSPAGMNAALGLAVHPTQALLYVGFVMRSQVGVYEFDRVSGALTFVTAAANSGMAICWLTTNAAGTRMYTQNSGDDSVSFYDLANPRAPVERQRLALRDPGPSFTPPGMTMAMPASSNGFQQALDPTEHFLYVVGQRVTTDTSYTGGNVLHILSVGADGMLTEPAAPMALPVPTTARPQGLVVL